MSDFPPKEAVEAGCGALWPGVSTTPARVAAVLVAAHEAGEIVWRTEHERAVALLRKQRRKHLDVEDCWYSCPKAEDGCCNEEQGDECNCGADAANAEIDAFLALREDR